MRGLALFLLAVGCVIRFIHLDADPHYYAWFGHISDEGRWVEHARSLAQTGVAFEHFDNYNLFVAPGFEIATYVSFATLGVDRISARIFTAICGSGLLILFWWHLRRHASPSGLLIGLALVALQADYVVLSRLAIPEMPAMLGELVTFLAVASGPPQRLRLFAGGLALAATLALKATTFPLALIFAVVVLGLRDGPVGAGRRVRDLLWFASGLLAAALTAVILLVPIVAPRLGTLMGHFELLRNILGLNSPYGMVARLFEGIAASVLVAPALGLWVGALATFADRDRGAHEGDGRLLRSASVWCVGFVIAMALQSYVPARYMIHLLTPLCLVCGYAVTRLERVRLSGLVAALGSAQRARRLLGAGILAFPTAILLAAGLDGLVGILGAPAERLIARLACLLLTLALAWVLADRLRRSSAAVGFLLIFPVATATLWFAGWALRESGISFWPHPPYAPALAVWLGLVASGSWVSAAVWGWGSRLGSPRLVAALAVSWAAIWGVHIAPGFLDPHFTVRDASRDLGTRFAGAPEIAQYMAQGLFIDNALPMRTPRVSLKSETPRLLVTRAPFPGDRAFLRDHYELVTSYDLYSPKIARGPRPKPSLGACPDQTGHCVAVYRLRDQSP